MDAFTELIENLVECARCGRLCKLGPQPNPEARLMLYATEKEADRGLCADCAATLFIKSVATLMSGIEQNGIQMLLDPRIQKHFGQVMAAGKADAKPEELNWKNIVENWDK